MEDEIDSLEVHPPGDLERIGIDPSAKVGNVLVS